MSEKETTKETKETKEKTVQTDLEKQMKELKEQVDSSTEIIVSIPELEKLEEKEKKDEVDNAILKEINDLKKKVAKAEKDKENAEKEILIDRLVRADYDKKTLETKSKAVLEGLIELLAEKDGTIKVSIDKDVSLEVDEAVPTIIDPVHGEMEFRSGRFVAKEKKA